MVVKWLLGLAALAAVVFGMGQAWGSSRATEHSSPSRSKAGAECIKGRYGRVCGTGVTIGNSELAISLDGKNGYLIVPFLDGEGRGGGVWIYDRDPATGSLVQKRGTAGCIAQPGRGCARGRALRFGYDIAISPEGRNVYASTESSIAIFDRDPTTGALTQPTGAAGCITSDRKQFPTCARGRSLGGGMAISPDGLNVYVGSAALDRDPTTGALTQKPGSGGAKPATGDVIVSPDGKNVYVVTFEPDRIETFDRDPASGALTRVPGRAGCVSEEGKGGCRRGHEFSGAFGLSISPDGRNVYAATSAGPGQPDYGTLMILDRLPDGTLAQKKGRAGCFALFPEGADCARADSLSEANDVTVSADGRRVFVFNYYEMGAEIFIRHPSGRLTKVPDR